MHRSYFHPIFVLPPCFWKGQDDHFVSRHPRGLQLLRKDWIITAFCSLMVRLKSICRFSKSCVVTPRAGLWRIVCFPLDLPSPLEYIKTDVDPNFTTLIQIFCLNSPQRTFWHRACRYCHLAERQCTACFFKIIKGLCIHSMWEREPEGSRQIFYRLHDWCTSCQSRSFPYVYCRWDCLCLSLAWSTKNLPVTHFPPLFRGLIIQVDIPEHFKNNQVMYYINCNNNSVWFFKEAYP